MNKHRTPQDRRGVLFASLLATVAALTFAISAAGQSSLEDFRLREHFGVSHAEQVVVFDLRTKTAPEKCRLLDDAGQEVPCQFVDGGVCGSIAFCTDLPANTIRTFKLIGGSGPTAVDGVKVDESNPDYVEIVNGLTGVRVPTVYAPLSYTPKAPIQGMRFRDGTWLPPGTPPTVPEQQP
jgi:hypothetical protein